MTAESRHSLPSRTFSGGHAVSNYKELEDMNLVDNFLFGTAVSNEEYGPLIAGTILETIFHRKIKIKNVQSEKVVWPSNPELHGIRLDAYIEEEAAAVELGNIYDIEPEKKSGEKTLLPKRCRYYHNRIDENQLKAGKEYYLLPTVWVIFITTFDPFSENRMVYTIRRRCVEEPEMPYDDGESTLFLYTKGTNGNPPDDLRDLLRYMNETTSENACNPSLKRVQDCIDKIKQNPTVRREYMDLQEFIDRERREAVAKAEEEKNKLSDQLKATVAERDKVSEKLDITTAERDKAAAERDKATAERDQIRIDQRNYQELTSILIDKNLFDELKHAAEDEAYRESLYVEYGVKPAQD
jgi:predicted transposase/invertase (TIGR01784 family)